ncbi:MAG: PD40 domain-containing protein [Candidatus Rokubacteria bacterium]|nr:PD40 domain-containing protein [Candidatus Rokubacteria bacterium]
MQFRHILPFTAALILLGWTLFVPWSPRPAPRAQGVDVFLNVTAGGARKLNIAIPEFTVVAGTDTTGAAKLVASVAGDDLTFSGLFSVVAATGSIPANDPGALKQSWTDFAAAGAHAAVHGLLAVRGDRLEAEMRLYDLTTPEQRLIAARKFEAPAGQPRRLAHKIADEIVLQFTGEAGIADTKIAYVRGPRGAREIHVADYDGANATPVTRNGSINLMPAWSPDARSLAFVSYMKGYPDLYRAFPFERRPEQTLAAFVGINTSPAWSPDGRTLGMTLSKDGNPEIYVLTLATGALRRLTRHAGIDTEPTWSPTGRQIAFVSDRAGVAHIFVMDAEGTSVQQLTFGGFQTQPRWSPKGDTIVYTAREGSHDLWAIAPDGSNARRLTAGPGNNQGAAWSPNGRHLIFQSSRLGGWQLFAMLADGSSVTAITRGPTEHTSPSWSPRLP